MRIMIVQPMGDAKGHYGWYATQFSQEFASQGHEVILCTNKIDMAEFLPGLPQFDVVEVGSGRYAIKPFELYKRKLPLLYNLAYMRNSAVVLDAALKLAMSKDVEVMYVLDAEKLISSIVLRRHRNLPTIIWLIQAANFSFNDCYGSLPRKLYKLVQKAIFKQAVGRQIKGFHVLGEWHETMIRKQLDLPEQFPILGLTDAMLGPDKLQDKEGARQHIGAGDYHGTLILQFGMLRRDKGIEILLEAMSLLRDEDFKLLIVGEPSEYSVDQLMKLIHHWALEDKVITRFEYIPERDVYSYFFACDAVIFPYRSFYRGGTGPLRQATMAGLPVLASDVSEMGRLVRLHNLGYLMRPDDPHSIAEQLRAFLKCPPEQKRIFSENCFRFAESYSLPVICKKLTDFFQLVANGQH
jgi:glycosyltransferase involved in cell wall biosynthesis